MQARVEGSEDAPDVQGDGRCGSLPLGVERPEWCRTALYNLLRSTMEVLGSGGVVHWLEFGTLLGAVRETTVVQENLARKLREFSVEDEKRKLQAAL